MYRSVHYLYTCRQLMPLRGSHQWRCWLAATGLGSDTCSTAALARCWHWTWSGCCMLGPSMEKFQSCKGRTSHCIALSIRLRCRRDVKQKYCSVVNDLWTSEYVLRESLSRHTESVRCSIVLMLMFWVWIFFNRNRKGLESSTICMNGPCYTTTTTTVNITSNNSTNNNKNLPIFLSRSK